MGVMPVVPDTLAERASGDAGVAPLASSLRGWTQARAGVTARRS